MKASDHSIKSRQCSALRRNFGLTDLRAGWLRKPAALCVLLGMAVLTGCSAGKQEKENLRESTVLMEDMEGKKNMGEYKKITIEEAKARIDSGDDLVILDVRTAFEYEAGHIKGAVLKPNEEIGTEPLEELPDLDQEILVYCRSGNRSAQAAKKLAEAGYTNVYDFGGINDWLYETEKGT